MTCGDYSHLYALLGAQHPLSPDHNEMLFIIQHQSELWIRLKLHERIVAIADVTKDELNNAFTEPARVSKIMEQLVHAWDVLAACAKCRTWGAVP